LREGSRCGIQIGCWRWRCEFRLSVHRVVFPKLLDSLLRSHLRPSATTHLKILLRKFQTTHTSCISLAQSQQRRSRQTCGELCSRTYAYADLLDTARTVPTADVCARSAPDKSYARRKYEASNRESGRHKAFDIEASINERCLCNSL
jgi:hypothetical protein